MSERKSERLEVAIWLDKETMRVHMALPDNRITTVADDDGERSHRHLYNHLRAILEARGKW